MSLRSEEMSARLDLRSTFIWTRMASFFALKSAWIFLLAVQLALIGLREVAAVPGRHTALFLADVAVLLFDLVRLLLRQIAVLDAFIHALVLVV